MDLSPNDLIALCTLFLLVVLSTLTRLNVTSLPGMTGWIAFWLVPDQPELRDVYVRGIRGDLWDWLFAWKGRSSYGLIINILLEEWRDLDERERRRILLKHQPPDR